MFSLHNMAILWDKPVKSKPKCSRDAVKITHDVTKISRGVTKITHDVTMKFSSLNYSYFPMRQPLPTPVGAGWP